MSDVHTKKQRSYNMSKIKGKNTGPELRLKKILKILGFSYQTKMYGKPDFANIKEKIAVFVDGCFWHRCSKHYTPPKQNKKFWKEKIERNIKRDKEVTQKLRKDGWRVIRVWEHDIKKIK